MIMAKKILKKNVKLALGLFNEWRTRLHLLDWKIKIHIVTDEEMDKIAEEDGLDDTPLGLCEPYLLRKVALIYILEPGSDKFKSGHEDFESTLVHELLHVHLCGIPNELVVCEEQTVETLTYTLMELKYGDTI